MPLVAYLYYNIIIKVCHLLSKFSFTDRRNLAHFIDTKKNDLVYVGSDGYPIAKIIDGDGDCVVSKNGSLHAAPCDIPAYFACENRYLNQNNIKVRFNLF